MEGKPDREKEQLGELTRHSAASNAEASTGLSQSQLRSVFEADHQGQERKTERQILQVRVPFQGEPALQSPWGRWWTASCCQLSPCPASRLSSSPSRRGPDQGRSRSRMSHFQEIGGHLRWSFMPPGRAPTCQLLLPTQLLLCSSHTAFLSHTQRPGRRSLREQAASGCSPDLLRVTRVELAVRGPACLPSAVESDCMRKKDIRKLAGISLGWATRSWMLAALQKTAAEEKSFSWIMRTVLAQV